MSNSNLVITGTSSISTLGIGFEEMAKNLATGSKPSSVKAFEFHELDRETACFRLPEFVPAEILGKKGLRTKDLATKILLATMELQFKERFESEPLESKPGIVVGTAFGSVQSIGDFLSDSIVNGVNAVNPMLFANTVINSPTGNANIRYGVKTLSTTVSTAFNAGVDSIIYSCDHIRCGYLNAIVVGGLEEVSYYTLLGLERSGVLSQSGESKPFAVDADGMVIGEGCAMFFVETAESAQAHGASPVVEIAGYCNAFDPAEGPSGFNPEGEGARYVIEQTLAMAGVDASAVDFIAAGGNGSVAGDTMESKVLSDIFGDTPVAAYKALTGECYGASSTLSLACAIADMKAKRVSGVGSEYAVSNNINLVSTSLSDKESEYALCTTFSCDGNCSALLIKNR